MKPFTLEWWLEKLDEAESKEMLACYYDHEQITRYALLALWIKKRIVNKYGE